MIAYEIRGLSLQCCNSGKGKNGTHINGQNPTEMMGIKFKKGAIHYEEKEFFCSLSNLKYTGHFSGCSVYNG